MADKTLIFGFYELSDKDSSIKKAKRYFAQAGVVVTSIDVDAKTKRAMGTSFREVHFGFADSQTVSFGVKNTGDVYQIKVNGRLTPIKSQDDHLQAIKEIAALLDKNRAKFQAALAKVKVALPASIRTAAPKMEQVLREKIVSVDDAIAAAKEKLSSLQALPA